MNRLRRIALRRIAKFLARFQGQRRPTAQLPSLVGVDPDSGELRLKTDGDRVIGIAVDVGDTGRVAIIHKGTCSIGTDPPWPHRQDPY